MIDWVMRNRTCMITGANAGIGFATAQRLAATGTRLVLICRSKKRGEKAAAVIRKGTGNRDIAAMQCDLSSQASIREFAKTFNDQFDRLDVLINNAAMYSPQRESSVDGIELQFATNYLGPFLLTRLLLDKLIASAPSRIINLSTINHFDASLDLDDLQSEATYVPKEVHMRTKLAVIMFTYELARRLQGTGVTANCLHPGVVATNLLGDVRQTPPDKRFTPAMGGDPLEVGAKTPVYLATSPDIEGVSGQYFDECRAVESSAESRDEIKGRQLWEISEHLTGMVET